MRLGCPSKNDRPYLEYRLLICDQSIVQKDQKNILGEMVGNLALGKLFGTHFKDEEKLVHKKIDRTRRLIYYPRVN